MSLLLLLLSCCALDCGRRAAQGRGGIACEADHQIALVAGDSSHAAGSVAVVYGHSSAGNGPPPTVSALITLLAQESAVSGQREPIAPHQLRVPGPLLPPTPLPEPESILRTGLLSGAGLTPSVAVSVPSAASLAGRAHGASAPSPPFCANDHPVSPAIVLATIGHPVLDDRRHARQPRPVREIVVASAMRAAHPHDSCFQGALDDGHGSVTPFGWHGS